MEKFILAAALLAPLVVAVPAFAQGAGDAAAFIETPPATTHMPNRPREFTSQKADAGRPAGVTDLERSLIQREVVVGTPSGAQ